MWMEVKKRETGKLEVVSYLGLVSRNFPLQAWIGAQGLPEMVFF